MVAKDIIMSTEKWEVLDMKAWIHLVMRGD